MTVTLDLSARIQLTLEEQARALGIPFEVYVTSLLERLAGSEPTSRALSPEEFEAELDGLAQGSENLPYLPPQALTRESIYQDHD